MQPPPYVVKGEGGVYEVSISFYNGHSPFLLIAEFLADDGICAVKCSTEKHLSSACRRNSPLFYVSAPREHGCARRWTRTPHFLRSATCSLCATERLKAIDCCCGPSTTLWSSHANVSLNKHKMKPLEHLLFVRGNKKRRDFKCSFVIIVKKGWRGSALGCSVPIHIRRRGNKSWHQCVCGCRVCDVPLLKFQKHAVR